MATVEVDGRVADLAGDVRRAVKQLAVDDQTAADAGADRHPDDVPAAARRALPPFADRRAVRVVVERDGQAQAFADSIAQGEVFPTEVRSDDDESLFTIQWTGRPHADADDVASIRIRLGERIEHHAFDQPDDTIRHAFCTRLGARWNRAHGEVLLAVRRHRADDDVRSAQVDADDVLLSFLGAHSATLGEQVVGERCHRGWRNLAHAPPMSESRRHSDVYRPGKSLATESRRHDAHRQAQSEASAP